MFPTIDVGLYAWLTLSDATQPGSFAVSTLCFNIVSRLFFWFGCLLTLRFATDLIDAANGRIGGVLLSALTRLTTTAAILYFLLTWSFALTHGHQPNPDALVFLSDNLARLPQHVLQTSPTASVLTILFATLIAYLTEKTVAGLPIHAGRLVDAHRPLGLLFGAALLLFAATETERATESMAPQMAVVEKPRDPTRPDKEIGVLFAALPDKNGPVEPLTPARRYPVIVVLVESLRHDLLTTHPEAIPFLKSLHDSQLGFERAYATASHSNFTDLAFWYSQYPLRTRSKENYPIDAAWRGTSLFGAFKNAGYVTAYISSQNEKWGQMINWLKTGDIDHFYHSEDYQGETWENFDDLPGLGGMIKRGLATAGKIEDSETLRLASEWIERQTRGKRTDGFFLGMNLQNTHFSYVMPPNGSEPYQPSDLGFKAIYYRWPQDKKTQVRNRYLNSVVNVDRLLADFSATLKRQGLWDECMFVVVGDNGEAFYEHGFGNHSGPMYDEVVRTFSVIKLPDSMRQLARTIPFPVSHIDIAASIPTLAGIPVPQSFQGIPLLAATSAPRPVFMYSNAIVRQYGIVLWPWKLLLTEFPQPRSEFYNLAEDSAEILERSVDQPEELETLNKHLTFWIHAQKRYYEQALYLAKKPPTYLPAPPSDNGSAPDS